ncbi:IS30 family transposase [Raoultibacter timonensis]|uniref:IS30 family transposase n=1 Tax=Raoultibacter timonensis TaxID=1907662 RepID=UPI0026DB4FBA|nr:IS30 family transposase [Raoultibacter timonensis]
MPKKERGHLTQGDRMFIEERLRDSTSIPDIARKLGVEPSTVRRDIQRNCVKESPSFMVVETRNICLRKDACRITAVCGNGCIMACRKCSKSLCNGACPEFKPNLCPWLTKPPYVCNDCRKRYGMGCEYEYRFYDGRIAHEMATKRKVESRTGIDCTREQLEEMACLVRLMLKKGQSPEHIWANHGERLPISLRTFYNYVELGVFGSIVNLDLPKKVVFKVRKRKADPPMPRHDLEGRAYGDFCRLSLEEQMNAVEMDCVVSARGSDKAILTLLFRRFSFQLMLYLPAKNQSEVGRALDMIESLIGVRKFKKWFGVILTDRGSEFLDYFAIERSAKGKGSRCRVFYCDPMKSGQKGRCEKNHVELRKILPKGTSFQYLTPRKLAVVCSHVNSYSRPALGGATPYQLARQVLPEELFDGFGVERIEPDEVVMKPGLVDL